MARSIGLSDVSLAARGRWHTITASVLAAWIIAGMVVAAGYMAGWAVSWWDAIHLFTIGGLTTAIIVYSTHFVEALTRTGASGYAGVAVRVVLVQVGLITLIVDRPGVSWSFVSDIGAAIIVAVLVWQILVMARRLRASLAGQFAVTVPYYIAAAAFLVLAIIYAILAGHRVADYDALIAAHSRATVFGFAYLTVLGTVVTLLPTLSGTSIVPAARARATRGLVIHAVALLAATVAEAAGAPRVAGVAALGVVVGAVMVTQPVLHGVLTGETNWTAATTHVSAGLLWLIGLAATDSALTIAGAAPREVTASIAPALVGAGFLQLVTGVLHHLLPTLIGGGPPAVHAGRSNANRAGPARLILINLGGVISLVHPVGVVLIAMGIVWNIMAIASAVLTQYRVKGNSQ